MNTDNIVKYELLHTTQKGVGVGWMIFWLIVFWPALIIILLMGKKIIYTVQVEYIDSTVNILTLREEEYQNLLTRLVGTKIDR